MLTFAAVLSVVNLAFAFPGFLNNDAIGQYQQSISGQVTDWHPPIMARLWQLFRPVANPPWTLLVLNLALYWSGFTLVADALMRVRRAGSAYILLVFAASPLMVYFNRQIITDVGLASAMVGSFGIVFWFRSQGRPIAIFAWPILGLVLAYGILVRSNAVFAAGPLLCYAFGFRPAWPTTRWSAVFVAISLLLLPVTVFVNRAVLGAADTGALQRPQIYDIVGTAAQSGDMTAVQKAAGFVPGPLSACYTPVLWDTLLTARCGNLWYHLPPPATGQRARVTRLWLASVFRHPIAYAVHRLEHFNLETFFMIPPAAHCIGAPALHECGSGTRLEDGRIKLDSHLVAQDYLLKNFLVWPICWIAFGIALSWAFRRYETDTIGVGARVLLSSGLIYALSYLLVGIAMNVRYFYWTETAVAIAAILLLSDSKARRDVKITAVIAPVIAVIAIGYLFRVADIRLFLY